MDLVTGRLTFRRFRDLLASMPGDGTAMWRKGRRERPEGGKRAVEPPDEWWTAERDLLATIADGVSVLAWLQTKDAQRGRNRPKPIPRPGVTPTEQSFGTAMSAHDLLIALGRTTN